MQLESIERRVFEACRLTEQSARDAGKPQQRSGLHCLQGRDLDFVERVTRIGETAFGRKIEHLAPGHAAEPGRAGERQNELDADGGVRMGRGAPEYVEGQGQEAVADEDRGRLIEGLVHGGAAAA